MEQAVGRAGAGWAGLTDWAAVEAEEGQEAVAWAAAVQAEGWAVGSRTGTGCSTALRSRA